MTQCQTRQQRQQRTLHGLLMDVRPRSSTVMIKKLKRAVGITSLLFRQKVSSRHQHNVQALLRDGGVIVFVVIYCCRRLRHVHLRHNDDVSFGVIVHRQCKSRFNRCLQCTLDCLQCTLINKSALQTTRVHCRQRSQRSVTDIPGE